MFKMKYCSVYLAIVIFIIGMMISIGEILQETGCKMEYHMNMYNVVDGCHRHL